MSRLARSASALKPSYDAVVVGSGYGGGVAASRLARMGLKVAVLERGREWLPGEFPRTMLGAQGELQMTGPRVRLGKPMALFDLRLGSDVHVLQGCGLGGTSLINANVCLTPDPRVLEDAAWPELVRTGHWLNLGFHRARAVLAPEPLPTSSTPTKLKALEKAGAALGKDVERVPLHIAFAPRVNAAGVRQPACTECGDCMGGCNVGAKTTVHTTYLADAANHGAEIFTGLLVRAVDRSADGLWHVIAHRLDRPGSPSPVRRIAARTVVLAAGTLGSNEILLRSRERGLALSERLGKRVTTNADAIAFGYNNNIPVNAVGIGHPPRPNVPKPGPGVAGLIDLRRSRDPLRRIAVVEAAIQSAMAPILPLALAAGSVLGVDTDRGLQDRLAEFGRGAESLVLGAYRGAARNTQVFLAVGHDSGAGEIVLEGDRPRIVWPNAAAEPVYGAINAVLAEAVKATGGTFIPNPATSRLLGGNLFTVHPLGGCTMAGSRELGVVDGRGRVFDGDPAMAADKVHAGLYVCDGSVMPRSLGVHPLLTITALAECVMLHFARDRGLALGVEPMAKPPLRDPVATAAAPATAA